jgi:hypothetical protein
MHLIEVIIKTDEEFLGVHKLLDLQHEVTEVYVCVCGCTCTTTCVCAWGKGTHKMGVEIGMMKSGCTLGL